MVLWPPAGNSAPLSFSYYKQKYLATNSVIYQLYIQRKTYDTRWSLVVAIISINNMTCETKVFRRSQEEVFLAG